MRLTLREVKVLKTLPHHVNIVKLLEAFRSHSGRWVLPLPFAINVASGSFKDGIDGSGVGTGF
jgi:hypothetical protein